MASRVTPFDEEMAGLLKNLRVQAKLTQPQVASHLGITYQSYQKMEGGKHAFRLATVVSLAELYQVDIGDLVRGSVSVDPVKARCHYLIEKMDFAKLELASDALSRINNS